MATAVAALGLLAAVPQARAQQPRPWLDWKTVETENFVFHYPSQYRTWTLALAQRMEGIRTQVGSVVGYMPPRRVHVVVDDPLNDANGVAFTTLDAPTIVLWPTPPDPRDEIGNFRVWAELVATHEFAHVAHLVRPSRNRLRGLLWSLSPVPLGPIASNAPRWVLEGYATYVEGRVTGTGRPNNAWRAAVLRQFALEGRLPGYAQLSANGSWETGNFAYLAGSAYFDWLSRREGDSSVTALWRRMTAKTVRSFDEAFVGVYGSGPAELYGRFVAEVTADALAFERALARNALVPGTLVQRLIRNTGDPAISPDGRFVALAIRHTDAPSEVVVWRTADEPDTLAARRRESQVKRDPDDVPDRSFYPAPKRVIISLVAADGAAYESPRWLPDNKRLLLSRRMPMSDGALRADLFLWSAEDGALSRVTTGASLRDADPSADGRWAAAVHCDQGWCDLVRVDLGTGAFRTLLRGSPTRNYYRPRVSKRTGEIAVAEQSGDRWRIARVSSADGATRYADPDDGITRFDATYDIDGSTIIATSEAGGIANLERLDPADSHATRLTAVTGAAVAADVAPDGTLWFLSLQAHGYDLRRIRADSASNARVRNATVPLRLALLDSLSPVLPPRRPTAVLDSSRRPQLAGVGTEHRYGFGPTRLRYVPGLTSGYGGTALHLAVVRSDPVGRFGAALLASAGAGALPAGVAMEITTRQSRNSLVGSGWASHEAGSRQFAGAFGEGLDLARFGGALRLQRTSAGDGGEVVRSIGLMGERQQPSALGFSTRIAAIGALRLVGRQRDEDNHYQEQLAALAEMGQTDQGSYLRERSAIFFGLGTNSRPLATARIAYGTVGGGGSLREKFVIGGFASPLIDPMYDARRVDAPAYPVGSSTATTYSAFRVGYPLAPLELFYAGVSTDLFKTSLRSYGLEFSQAVPAIPALGTPDVEILTGFARAIDPPVEREWRYYLTLSIRP